MGAKELYATAMRTADGCLAHIYVDQLQNSTPCSEWDIKALLNHMVYEVLWVPDMLAGKTIAEIGTKYDGDVLGQDFVKVWKEASSASQAAVADVDLRSVVHTSFTNISAEEYITQIAGDLYVHTWDADQAVQCSLCFVGDVDKLLYEYYLPKVDEWRRAGAFGAEVEVLETASYHDKLLGLLGRTPVQVV